jgi:hypothetical protein
MSSGVDDAESVAVCPPGEVGLSCRCEPRGYCDGAAFDGDGVTCRAFKKVDGNDYGYVRVSTALQNFTLLQNCFSPRFSSGNDCL